MRNCSNSAWLTSWKYPYFEITNNPSDDDELFISYFWEEGTAGVQFRVKRKDARLLARRINKCLDSTYDLPQPQAT